MLIRITNFKEIDGDKLMSVYAESNLENADYFYPQIEDKYEAVKRVENDFLNFVKTKFLNGTNVYYVLEIGGVWVSALRLNCLYDGFYYLEALETSPTYRKRGFATELLTSVINELKSKGKFKICDVVSKKNTASIAAHIKCGFTAVSEDGYDYLQKETVSNCYGLEYSFKPQ